jgi:peptidoglycan/LPS O-acetylase OafA/YrhL
MNVRRLNWPLWVGFLLTLAAFITYTSVFVYFPVTRDFPWVNLLIFAVAVVLLIIGLRRGFASDRPHPTRSKVVSSIVGVLGFAVFAFFIFVFFIAAKWLPASTGAPQVGERAPEFTLPDTTGKQVSLTQLLSTPVNGLAPKGVLVVFYRGYW